MKKVLLFTLLSTAFLSQAIAQEGPDPFTPAQSQTNNGSSSVYQSGPAGMDPEMEMLRDELRMQLEEMRSLRNELVQIKEENTEEAKEEQAQEELESESTFIGLVDNVMLYKNKDTGEFFTLKKNEKEADSKRELNEKE